MSRSDHKSRPRLQIPVTPKQRGIIEAAAERAASDVNTWSLAQVMAASTRVIDGMPAGSPIVLSGGVADRLRALASSQGVSPARVVEQLLLAREAP